MKTYTNITYYNVIFHYKNKKKMNNFENNINCLRHLTFFFKLKLYFLSQNIKCLQNIFENNFTPIKLLNVDVIQFFYILCNLFEDIIYFSITMKIIFMLLYSSANLYQIIIIMGHFKIIDYYNVLNK
jgi:hypothetical protein